MNKSTDSNILKLGDELCFQLYACAKEIIRLYRKPLEKINLTYTQYIVMMSLWKHGTMTEKELGSKLYLDSGTLTPVLKKLEKSGFLKRKRLKEDERSLNISLTDSGIKLKEKASSIPEVLNGCISLTYEEILSMHQMLEKSLEGTKKYR